MPSSLFEKIPSLTRKEKYSNGKVIVGLIKIFCAKACETSSPADYCNRYNDLFVFVVLIDYVFVVVLINHVVIHLVHVVHHVVVLFYKVIVVVVHVVELIVVRVVDLIVVELIVLYENVWTVDGVIVWNERLYCWIGV